MASPCNCCGQIDPCNCIPVTCAAGTTPGDCLLCTIVFPSGQGCCCPYPGGGVESFAMRRRNLSANLFPFPWQPSPCQTPCNNVIRNWDDGFPFGCAGGFLNRCLDRGAVPCAPSSNPCPQIYYGFGVILWICRSGAPGFFLDFYGSPDYAFQLCTGGTPCGYDCTDPGTLPQAKVLIARCQSPDSTFNQIGVNCNDLYLEWTVNPATGATLPPFNPGACGPITVIIQTPP